jgi:hypothetical protein
MEEKSPIPDTFIAGKFSHLDSFVNELFNEFNNQAGTNKVIISKLTGLIPPHFYDCLPFILFTIADYLKFQPTEFKMFAQLRKAYLPRSDSGMGKYIQEYHPISCESKSCRYPANRVCISCAEFKFFPQYTFSMIDDFHHVHCLTIRRTAIARK